MEKEGKTLWIFEKYAGMAGTDEEWDRAVDEAGEVINRYRNTDQYEFAKALVLAAFGEIERRDKYRRGQLV